MNFHFVLAICSAFLPIIANDGDYEGMSDIFGEENNIQAAKSNSGTNADDTEMLADGVKAYPFSDSTREPCFPSPCLHGGLCHLDPHTTRESDFVCTCQSGYRGKKCEEVILQCDKLHCPEKGDCVSTTSGYVCICKDKLGGKLCELISAHPHPYRVVKKLENKETAILFGELILILLWILVAIIAVILCIHYCRVGSRRHNIVRTYNDKLARGETLTSLPPEWYDVSNQVCSEFFTCFSCCREPVGELNDREPQLSSAHLNVMLQDILSKTSSKDVHSDSHRKETKGRHSSHILKKSEQTRSRRTIVESDSASDDDLAGNRMLSFKNLSRNKSEQSKGRLRSSHIGKTTLSEGEDLQQRDFELSGDKKSLSKMRSSPSGKRYSSQHRSPSRPQFSRTRASQQMTEAQFSRASQHNTSRQTAGQGRTANVSSGSSREAILQQTNIHPPLNHRQSSETFQEYFLQPSYVTGSNNIIQSEDAIGFPGVVHKQSLPNILGTASNTFSTPSNVLINYPSMPGSLLVRKSNPASQQEMQPEVMFPSVSRIPSQGLSPERNSMSLSQQQHGQMLDPVHGQMLDSVQGQMLDSVIHFQQQSQNSGMAPDLPRYVSDGSIIRNMELYDTGNMRGSEVNAYNNNNNNKNNETGGKRMIPECISDDTDIDEPNYLRTECTTRKGTPNRCASDDNRN